MADLETLRTNDQALREMHKQDTENGTKPLSPEDEQAFKELIEGQRKDYQDTLYLKKSENGDTSLAIAPSIGNAALHNPNSQIDNSTYLGNSKGDDWRVPK